jgi:hypothetical protein
MPAQCRPTNRILRTTVSLIPVGLIAIAIAACGTHNDAAPLPTDTRPLNTISEAAPRPSSTPTPAAISTTLPADVPTIANNPNKIGEKPPLPPAQTTGPLGAQTFARFYMKTNDWAYATGSTTYMRHYFLPSCVECSFYASGIDRRHRAGERYIGDRITVRSVQSIDDESNVERQSVLVDYDVTSVEAVDAVGRFVDAAPAARSLHDRLDLIWTRTGWLVAKGTAIK